MSADDMKRKDEMSGHAKRKAKDLPSDSDDINLKAMPDEHEDLR